MFSITVPDCPGDLEFNLCGSSCERTCTNQDPVCNEMCVPKCECPSGQIRLNPQEMFGDPVCGTRDQCGEFE